MTDKKKPCPDLNDCPFCGDWAQYGDEQFRGVSYDFVICGFCDARSGGYRTKDEAREAWNKRSQPAKPCAPALQNSQAVVGMGFTMLRKSLSELQDRAGRGEANPVFIAGVMENCLEALGMMEANWKALSECAPALTEEEEREAMRWAGDPDGSGKLCMDCMAAIHGMALYALVKRLLGQGETR